MDARTILDLALLRADSEGDRVSYCYLDERADITDSITYAKLDLVSRAIASRLQSQLDSHDRALLVFRPGLEFITAFFGCIYAGVIPVPCPAPRSPRIPIEEQQYARVAQDCGARAILTDDVHYERFEAALRAGKLGDSIALLGIGELKDGNAGGWRYKRPDANDTALLQYTSGSTSAPKGVIVSHANILKNCQLTFDSYFPGGEVNFVNWLPLFHDMGLIGPGVLQPMFVGARSDLISPMSFVRRPLVWLEAISRRSDSQIVSGGPSFAYQHCLEAAKDRDISALDLSNWVVAFNGADSIKADTMRSFVDVFSEIGFDEQAICPCYGLAEATLMVTGARYCRPLRVIEAETQSLKQGRVVPSLAADDLQPTELVSCGRSFPDQEVMIVDPDSREVLPETEVGEVWLSGACNAKGYWGKQEETAEVFRATLEDRPGKFYLKTGDLGALIDGELYITGRMKDLIIINGQNIYASDLEFEAQRSNIALRPGGCVAFQVDNGGVAGIVVAAELHPRYARQITGDASIRTQMFDSVAADVRGTVSHKFAVSIDEVLFVKAGSIPRTSSGKIQRSKAKILYANNELSYIT